MTDLKLAGYLQAERKNLCMLLGFFNLAAVFATVLITAFRWFHHCSNQHTDYVIPAASLEFALKFGLFWIGLEGLRRWLYLQFSFRHLGSALLQSLIHNLPGFPIFLLWMVTETGQKSCLVLWLVTVTISLFSLQKRQRREHSQTNLLFIFTSENHLRAIYNLAGVVLLLAFLFFISLPASHYECSGKISGTKANMHELQTMVETYALDHDGQYPTSVQMLEAAARQQNYWKNLNNRYANGHDCRYFLSGNCSLANYTDYRGLPPHMPPRPATWLNMLGFPVDLPVAKPPVQYWQGMVLYQFVSVKHYRIYGTDKNGNFIQDKGQDYYLSNHDW